jgi:hypothetical protein
MFFTNKDKAALRHEFECLYRDIRFLQNRLEIQTTRLDALMKVYPYGANSDGSPRQKPGRKLKVQA